LPADFRNHPTSFQRKKAKRRDYSEQPQEPPISVALHSTHQQIQDGNRSQQCAAPNHDLKCKM
jgi:hypothetical protein